MAHFRKQQVTVFPTNACNMRCTYCAADSSSHQERTQRISLRFARRGIADYFSDGKKHQLRFYSGGEPTQAMDVITECWDYARNIAGERLISEIQTNCYFTGDVANWLREHITTIWASIDGPPEIQNRYRPVPGDTSPAGTVLDNALCMRERTFVGIRCTIVPETVDDQVSLVEYFHRLGFRHVVSEPVFMPVRLTDVGKPGTISGVDIGRFARGFADAWLAAEEMGVSYVTSFIMNFDEKVEYGCRACLPTPHLTTDGYVSACDLGYYGNSPLKDLIYGRYIQEDDRIEYWPNAIERLRSRRCANMAACGGCFAQGICGGGCLGRAYHETRDFFGVIPEFCDAIRYLAKRLPLDRIRIDHLHP